MKKKVNMNPVQCWNERNCPGRSDVGGREAEGVIQGIEGSIGRRRG